MTKSEALAFGVSEDNYRAFMEVYHKDVAKRAAQKRDSDDADRVLRSAIVAMLRMIKKPETLESILQFINKQYYREV